MSYIYKYIFCGLKRRNVTYCQTTLRSRTMGSNHILSSSDESEPSCLEPDLKLKDFQLGSAFSPQLEIENWPKKSQNFDFLNMFFFM
jgi:hypothetical protein